MSVRRCPYVWTNRHSLHELPILPFLAPRVFTRWPKNIACRRAQGTAQTVPEKWIGKSGDRKVLQSGLKEVNVKRTIGSTERAGSGSSFEDVGQSRDDGTFSAGAVDHDIEQTSSEPTFQLWNLGGSGQSINSGGRRNGWAVHDETFRHAYDKIWTTRFENVDRHEKGDSFLENPTFVSPKVSNRKTGSRISKTELWSKHDSGNLSPALKSTMGMAQAEDSSPGSTEIRHDIAREPISPRSTSQVIIPSRGSTSDSRRLELQLASDVRGRLLSYRRKRSLANLLMPPVRSRVVKLARRPDGKLNSWDSSWTRRFADISSKYDPYLKGRRIKQTEFTSVRRPRQGIHQFARELICLSAPNLRSKWANLTESERQAQWPAIMLNVLDREPGYALKFLLATCIHPLPPSYAISDSLEVIAKFWLGEKHTVSKEDVAVLLRSVMALQSQFDRNYIELTQTTIYLLLQHVNGEQAENFYKHLVAAENPLHENTLLQFIGSLARHQKTVLAIEVLKHLHNQGTNFSKPQVESVCATLLLRKNRQTDVEVSDSHLFGVMLEQGLRPNIIFYNILLQNAVESGDSETSWSIYDIMIENGVEPDTYTYLILMQDAKMRLDLNAMKRTLDIVKSRKIKNPQIATDILHALFLFLEQDAIRATGHKSHTSLPFESLLPFYCENFVTKPLMDIAPLQMDRCKDLITNSDAEKMHPPKKTLVVMIIALLRGFRDPRGVVEFYDHFQALVREQHPDILPLIEETYVYDAIIMALGKHSETLHLCTKVVAEMISANAGETKLSSPSSAHQIPGVGNEGEGLFKKDRDPSTSFKDSPTGTPDLEISSSDFRSSLSSHRAYQTSRSKLKTLPPLPSVRTWSILLKAFMSHSQPHAAEKVLAMMRARGITPNIVTWNTLLFGYTQLQDAAMAIKVIERLENEGQQADGITMKALEHLHDQNAVRAMVLEKDKRAQQKTENGTDFTSGVENVIKEECRMREREEDRAKSEQMDLERLKGRRLFRMKAVQRRREEVLACCELLFPKQRAPSAAGISDSVVNVRTSLAADAT